MKRVLVTGATGFVGRAVLDPLTARGFEVHAVCSRPIPQKATAGMRWHRSDLLASGSAARLMEYVRPTHLLHLAWYAAPGKFWNARENFDWVRASLELLQAFHVARGRRFVVAGTCAEYDWRHGHCNESVTPLEPATTYGICKAALFKLAQAFAAESGVSGAWGRIFFPFGPHEYLERLTSYVVTSLLRGEPAECTSGDQLRDFLYVDNVADAFAALLDSEVTGPVNIASGESLSIRGFLGRIADRIGRPGLLRLGAKEKPRDEAPAVLADVSRLREEVGWSPLIDFDIAIDRTIEYWRRQPRLERIGNQD